jgi:hypothetical protein
MFSDGNLVVYQQSPFLAACHPDGTRPSSLRTWQASTRVECVDVPAGSAVALASIQAAWGGRLTCSAVTHYLPAGAHVHVTEAATQNGPDAEQASARHELPGPELQRVKLQGSPFVPAAFPAVCRRVRAECSLLRQPQQLAAVLQCSASPHTLVVGRCQRAPASNATHRQPEDVLVACYSTEPGSADEAQPAQPVRTLARSAVREYAAAAAGTLQPCLAWIDGAVCTAAHISPCGQQLALLLTQHDPTEVAQQALIILDLRLGELSQPRLEVRQHFVLHVYDVIKPGGACGACCTCRQHVLVQLQCAPVTTFPDVRHARMCR